MPSGPVLAYGDRNAACLEWSDGCVVCAREADGPHCSTPGIACQPGRNRLQAKDEVTTKKGRPKAAFCKRA